MWLFCDLQTGYVRVAWDAFFSESWRCLEYQGYAEQTFYIFGAITGETQCYPYLLQSKLNSDFCFWPCFLQKISFAHKWQQQNIVNMTTIFSFKFSKKLCPVFCIGLFVHVITSPYHIVSKSWGHIDAEGLFCFLYIWYIYWRNCLDCYLTKKTGIFALLYVHIGDY